MEPEFTFGVAQVLGLFSASGLAVVGLIKSGRLNIRIGKDNGAKPHGDSYDLADCEKKHDKMDETVIAWDKMAQTMILDQQEHKHTLKVHREKLEEGSARMGEFDNKLDTVGKGVAVLLDRTKDM